MLVLSRREGEELVIDGNIRVRIVRTKGNRVVVGVDAPMEVSVQRSELLTESGNLEPQPMKKSA
jgi:carbon storage regulator